MPVLLGVDLGERRVGLAVTDEAGIMALPLKNIEIRGRRHFLSELRAVIEQYAVKEVVVGLPKTLKGEIGEAAQKVMLDAEWYQSRLGVPFHFWDERLTSQEVERYLRDADIHHSRRKELRDQMAAQKILQAYLDHRRNC